MFMGFDIFNFMIPSIHCALFSVIIVLGKMIEKILDYNCCSKKGIETNKHQIKDFFKSINMITRIC